MVADLALCTKGIGKKQSWGTTGAGWGAIMETGGGGVFPFGTPGQKKNRRTQLSLVPVLKERPLRLGGAHRNLGN